MTRRVLFVALAAATALSASPAVAQDVGGLWELTSETPRGAQTMSLSLTQDGTKLTGTITMSMGGRGGGGGGARDVEIKNGTIEGNSFSFVVELSFNGNTITQTYKGTIDGDTMKGEVAGARGNRPFTGKRST